MTVVINGTSGITDVNGSAAAPAITGTDTDTGVFFGTNTVSLSTGGTERLQVDSSGNLGLGVTPSAWLSSTVATQIGNYGSVYAFKNSGNVYLNNNTYVNSGGSDVYLNTAPAGRYRISDNTHIWYNAPSGTAGTTATLTQAMTLDASGRLALGTTSPGCRLDVVSTGVTLSGTASLVGRFVQDTTTYRGVAFGFDSSGQIGIIYPESAGAGSNLAFWTYSGSAWGERARIDSSGNLLLMTTSSSITADVGIKFINGSAGNAYMGIVNSSSINGNANYHLYSTGAGAYRFYVGMGGTIYATSTSISALSDQTLKTNIRDLETGLTEVMALKPRRFDWINGDATNVAGFVAQEVEQVLPELVTDYIHNKDEEGNDITKKSLKMGDILPTLVKAIQEQQAIITQLQADVAALKGNA